MSELKRQIGQAFCPAAFIHDTPEGIEQIERYIRDFGIGGLTFFYSRQSVETNFDRKTYVREKDSVVQLARMIDRYQQLSNDPLLISIDAEWGLGMRIDSHPPFPFPLTFAASESPDLSFEVGRAIAKELIAVGVHFNLAPVVDINTNAENPVIGYRSFGEDPEKVFQLAWAYYEGMKSEGLLGCVKHFPGHGDTQVDSHLGLPRIDKDLETLNQNELYPFRQFVDRGIECVMVGHLLVPELDPELPTSISSKVITGLLREQWGFEGAVMSDALNMRSVYSDDTPGALELKAFNAGNDILCFTPNLEEAFEEMVRKADPQRIAFAANRVAELKAKALIEKPVDSTSPSSLELRESIALASVTILKPLTQHIGENDQLIAFFENSQAFSSDTMLEVSKEKDISLLESDLGKGQPIWVTVAPPSQKPGHQFGMSQPILDALNHLIDKEKVNLAWIGNPYGLKFIRWQDCHSMVLSYQNLSEFNAVIVDYWQGGPVPKGNLPVRLKRENTYE